MLTVNVSVVVAPFTIGFGENDLAIVGAGVGSPQPVKTILSIKSSEALRLFTPTALILKKVVPDPVAAAGVFAIDCQTLVRVLVVAIRLNDPGNPVVLE